MPKFILLLLLCVSYFLQAQCNDGEFDVSFETYSGEWAEEMSWSIIDNEGEIIFFYDGSENDNNSFYNQTICLNIGCYAFEANDSFGDGWNEGFVDVNSVNSDVDFGIQPLSIELENGSLGYTIFQINDSECTYSGLGCTDINANNYNENAFINDNSCEYSCQEGEYILEIETITGDWAEEMSWSIYSFQSWNEEGDAISSFQGNGNYQSYYTQICVNEPDCFLIIGNDSYGDGWEGGNISISVDGLDVLEEITIENGFDGYFTFEINEKACSWEFPGCMDESAYNYNEFATIDDGSCIAPLTFNWDKIDREYLLYTPTNLAENAPLVFVFHGYTGSAAGIMNYCGMNEVADANGFAVCYPQGTEDLYGNNFFNVGYDFQNNPEVDDLGFTIALAEYLQETHGFSNTNTFSTGMSNGGDFSYLLACQASETFRAIAPVSGMIMENIYQSCNPENPVPVFETHGTEDDVTLYDGDPYNNDGWGVYLGIPSTIDFFVNQNNLTDLNFTELPNLDNGDGSIIESYVYSSSNSNNEVWLYKVIGGGHDWPGSEGNMDVNISEEIWDFFSLMSISESVSTEELSLSKKELIKIVDLLGRETSGDQLQLNVYDDGSVEKKYIIK